MKDIKINSLTPTKNSMTATKKAYVENCITPTNFLLQSKTSKTEYVVQKALVKTTDSHKKS